jgi:hypothetical protein
MLIKIKKEKDKLQFIEMLKIFAKLQKKFGRLKE